MVSNSDFDYSPFSKKLGRDIETKKTYFIFIDEF